MLFPSHLRGRKLIEFSRFIVAGEGLYLETKLAVEDPEPMIDEAPELVWPERQVKNYRVRVNGVTLDEVEHLGESSDRFDDPDWLYDEFIPDYSMINFVQDEVGPDIGEDVMNRLLIELPKEIEARDDGKESRKRAKRINSTRSTPRPPRIGVLLAEAS